MIFQCKMLPVVGAKLLFRQSLPVSNVCRTFLTNSYYCQDAWEHRKKASIFEKIDYDDLFHQLDRSFQIGQRISGLDVDLFVSGIDSDIYQNELEDVLFKLRLNPESALLKDRTMHAVIRYFMSINKEKDLLNILANRLTYGIFPDHYASNMLIDSFLKRKDYTSAAKIAVLSMLQEDFSHPILHAFSLYSCLKYLSSPEIWSPPQKPAEDPDEDEIKVRVTFLRNPYFDDHFDLVNTNHLIGKTMSMAGGLFGGPIGLSTKLIGLALHEKGLHLKNTTMEILTKKTPVYKEAISRALEYTQTTPKQSEDSSAQQVEESEAVKSEKAEAIAILEKASKETFLLPGDVEEVVTEEVRKIVGEVEKKDIEDIKQLYKKWENDREEHIKLELYESQKRKTISEIAKIKENLVHEEERIFFFDKEDEWDLKVDEKQKEIKLLAEQQAASKKKKQIEEEYIPPEVNQKRV